MNTNQTKSAKCFLLAAGLGTRLRPLTESIPKCLLAIGGKPILSIWLEHLERHGISEVLINSHWLHEEVEAFVQKCRRTRRGAVLSYEPILLGSAGTLIANRDWLGQTRTFLIIYADTLTNADLTAMLAFHNQHGMPFTLGVFRTDNPRACGIANVSNDGVVTEFVEKPEVPPTDLAAAGVYVADTRIFDFFPEAGRHTLVSSRRPLDLSFDILPRLVGMMKAYVIQGPVIDIGTVQSYHRAQTAWPALMDSQSTEL